MGVCGLGDGRMGRGIVGVAVANSPVELRLDSVEILEEEIGVGGGTAVTFGADT